LGTKERGEQIAVAISLTELGYPKPTWDDAKKLAATLNREAARQGTRRGKTHRNAASFRNACAGRR
jgi:hypothetical protein